MLLAASGGNHDPSHVVNIGSVGGQSVSYAANNPSCKRRTQPSFVQLACADAAHARLPDLASKAAVAHLTRQQAAWYCRQGIVVNCIQPAVFPSKMTFDYQLKTDEGVEASMKSHPVGRYGSEDDMAGMALFLASRASAFMTGSVLNNDGGSAVIHGTENLPLPKL